MFVEQHFALAGLHGNSELSRAVVEVVSFHVAGLSHSVSQLFWPELPTGVWSVVSPPPCPETASADLSSVPWSGVTQEEQSRRSRG